MSQIGEDSDTFGAFGLQSLMAQIYSRPVNLTSLKPEVWKEYAQWEATRSTGVSSFIEVLPPGVIEDSTLDSTLFHERYHYWQLISSPAMIVGHLAHIRLVEERVISDGGDPTRLLTTQPFFQLQALRESVGSIRPLLSRLLTYEAAKDVIDDYKAVTILTAKEWLLLLQYLKWTIGETRLATTDSPRDYFIRLPLGSDLLVAMSRKSSLLDVLIRKLPVGTKWLVTPLSATCLIESQAYIAQCVVTDELPAIEPTRDDSSELPLYLEPWQAWYRVYRHQFRDLRTAARGYIAMVDLALTTDWAGQFRYYPDIEYHDEMVSPSYRFATLLRAHKRVRSGTTDSVTTDCIDWCRYQADVCRAMSWPGPKDAARRILEFVAVSTAIAFAAYRKFRMEDVIDLVNPDREETTEEELQNLPRVLLRIREGMGQNTPTYGLGLLEVMTQALLVRYNNPQYWADPLSMPPDFRIYSGFGLPVVWVNGRLHSEGGAPVIDFMRHISLCGLSALSGISDISLLSINAETQGDISGGLRLGFDEHVNPVRCGIESADVPCDHMLAGMSCPYLAGENEFPVATQCYFVDSMKRLRLDRFLPDTVELGEKWFKENPVPKPGAGKRTAHLFTDSTGIRIISTPNETDLSEFQDQMYEKVRNTVIVCPVCGETMEKSLSGLMLQCGERSRTLHPVVQWSPSDESFQTCSDEIASTLKSNGWQVVHDGTVYEATLPKE